MSFIWAETMDFNINVGVGYLVVYKTESDAKAIARIYGNGSTYLAVKLELGDQQTLAHQDADGNWVLNEIPNYGDQLRRCQRYCVALNPLNQEYPSIGVGVARSTTQVSAHIPLPVMRAVPSLTTNVSRWTLANGQTYITPTAVYVNAVGGMATQLFLTASGLVQGAAYEVYCYGNENPILSADL